MIISDSSKVLKVDKLGISEEDKNKVYIPGSILSDLKNSIYYDLCIINGEFYYCKYDYSKIPNELIGSYLAKKLELETVDYQIGMNDDDLLSVSKLLYEKGFEYYHASHHKNAINWNLSHLKKFPWKYLEQFRGVKKLRYFDEKIISKILKLITLDLKMLQYDRHGYNLMFKQNIETKELDLAPIYDYGNSYFFEKRCYYVNSFSYIKTTLSGIKNVIKKYPEIMQYFDIVNGLSMEQILSDIEKEKLIKFTDDEKKKYIDFDNEYSKVLKKL